MGRVGRPRGVVRIGRRIQVHLLDLDEALDRQLGEDRREVLRRRVQRDPASVAWTSCRGRWRSAPLQEARRRERLELVRELVVLPMASEGLRGLAAVAACHGDLDRAARLHGAALVHRHGQPEFPADVQVHDTFIAPARARHGTDAWDDAARTGAALGFHDAIAYALDAPSPRPAAIPMPTGVRHWAGGGDLYPPGTPSPSAQVACHSAVAGVVDALSFSQEVSSAPASSVIAQSGS
jgi:hypothetical protein